MAYKRHKDKEKYELVALYKMVGSLKTACGMLNIPFDTAKHWKATDWWTETEQEIAQENRAKTNTKIVKLAEKAMVVLEDRLESGDFQLDQKTGNVVRIPIRAETANKILHDSLNREEMNERLNQDSKKLITEEKMIDRLTQIQESFKKIAMGKSILKELPIIDIEVIEDALHEESEGRNGGYVNALHEERQEGLQEGGPVGQESQGPQRTLPSTSENGQASGESRDGQAGEGL